jgi:hypothetical protein
MLLVVGCPESDVMYSPASQARLRRIRPLDNPHLSSWTSRSYLEGDDPRPVLSSFACTPKAEHLSEHPRGRTEIFYGEIHPLQTSYANFLRDRTILP